MDWKTPTGQWSYQPDGSWRQSDNNQFSRALADSGADWTDYTFTVKARKTGGREGFLVYFHVQDDRNFVFWNLGGWGNVGSGLEQTIDSAKEEVGERENVTIETGRWYDIKIEVKGHSVRCLLDGKLITETSVSAGPTKLPVYTSATRDNATGDVILKVVNMGDSPQNIKIDLAGMGKVSQGTVEVLTGDPDGMNSVEAPMEISPHREPLTNAGGNFEHEFPGQFGQRDPAERVKRFVLSGW